MSAVSILVGDCLASLRAMADQSVNTCVTSPPYFGLRDYGHAGQIGLEQTPDEFVAKLVEVFREVRRVLRDDGTVWLNLGDSYSGSGKGPSGNLGKKHDERNMWQSENAKHTSKIIPDGLKPKDLIGIPWRVAFALQADGWYLRQDIIWHKPNPMPESVTDRCTKAHEYIFLLSKGPRYYFDSEAMQEDAIYGARGSEFHTGKTGAHQIGRASSGPRQSKVRGEFNGKTNALAGREAFRAIRDTRNRRSVWTVATKPFKGAHFATFPPELIEPCVLAGCPEGGTVLDPFGGAGTTGLVAARNNRNSILCELNREYAAMAAERIGLTATLTPPQPNHEKVDA
jgi:DNA modification methylase